MKTRIFALLFFAATAACGASTTSQLGRSESPRDWALAAEAMRIEANVDESDALMRKAFEAAPDDVLVQWLAALAIRRAAAGPPDAALERARRLAALESDNAVHFLPLLSLQATARDETGIDETLGKMAAASRFDEHYRDYLLAWADVWRRFPPAGWEFGTEVMTRMAAAPFPPYAAPVKACDPAGRDAAQARSRRENCEAIARRMLEGRTLIAQSIGYAILRRMNRMTPEDETAWLASQWIRTRMPEAMKPEDMLDPAFGPRLLDDWRDIGFEIPILRRQLEKAGIPTTPPPGWEPEARDAVLRRNPDRSSSPPSHEPKT